MRFCYFNKEFIESFDKPLRYAYFVFVSFLFCLPVLMLFLHRTDFMVIANESLAYRFIYSIRLHQGPDAGAWLPQGHLLTSVHHIITWFLMKIGSLSDMSSLRKSLNLFGFSSLGFDCFVMCGVFFASIKVSFIGWKERGLLALTALVSVFFMGCQPDYYHLNVVLIALTVFLFQVVWLYPRDDLTPFSLKMCAGVGFFAGILASNKVSIVTIGFPLFGLVIFSSPVLSCKDIIRRALIMAIGGFLAFSFIFMAAGQFQIEWLKNTLPGWLMFMRAPGSEPNFTEQFIKFLIKFCPIFLLFLGSILMVISNERKGKHPLKLKIVIYTVLLAAFFGIYSLWRRPANTTFGEVAAIFFGLSSISAVLLSKKKSINNAFLIFFIIMPVLYYSLYYTLNQYFLENTYGTNQNHSGEAEEKWNFATSLPKNTPIFLLIPDNSYYPWGDPFALFLKGGSDFPTWTISENGKKLFQKFFLPELVYYTEQSSDSAASRMLNKESLIKLLSIKNGVIFWSDPIGLPPMTERYPILKEVIQKPGVKFTSKYLPLSKAMISVLEIHPESS